MLRVGRETEDTGAPNSKWQLLLMTYGRAQLRPCLTCNPQSHKLRLFVPASLPLHARSFIKSKLKREADEVVIIRDGRQLTLAEVFDSLSLTAYDLSIDTLVRRELGLFACRVGYTAGDAQSTTCDAGLRSDA